MTRPPLFTAIVDTYNRPALLREAVGAFRRQTYENIEIILVNNGATRETIDYLHEVAGQDPRVRLVHFAENQYVPASPCRMLEITLNAALEVATGDYVWYQADDDLIADDYAEKMAALFLGHADCLTAAGLTTSIDLQGRVLDTLPRQSNYRPRYMPGHLLALDVLRGGTTMFGAPGTIFTIRRDALVRAGGYHRETERSHLYGIVPFGVTGFDETAVFYWRRHEGQLGPELAAAGYVGVHEVRAFLKEWEIERRWQVFGADLASEVARTIERRALAAAASQFVYKLAIAQLRPALSTARGCWRFPAFWLETIRGVRKNPALPLRLAAKLTLRGLFGLVPRRLALPPPLQALRARISRG